MNLLQAIAREEGFGIPNGRATRNNNPGDINWGAFAQAHGATRLEVIPDGYNEVARFAYFPDTATGFAAMKALFQTPSYKGLNVRQALCRYAPPADHNDTSAYEANVCAWVGCQPTTIIDVLLETV